MQLANEIISLINTASFTPFVPLCSEESSPHTLFLVHWDRSSSVAMLCIVHPETNNRVVRLVLRALSNSERLPVPKIRATHQI